MAIGTWNWIFGNGINISLMKFLKNIISNKILYYTISFICITLIIIPFYIIGYDNSILNLIQRITGHYAAVILGIITSFFGIKFISLIKGSLSYLVIAGTSIVGVSTGIAYLYIQKNDFKDQMSNSQKNIVSLSETFQDSLKITKVDSLILKENKTNKAIPENTLKESNKRTNSTTVEIENNEIDELADKGFVCKIQNILFKNGKIIKGDEFWENSINRSVKYLDFGENDFSDKNSIVEIKNTCNCKAQEINVYFISDDIASEPDTLGIKTFYNNSIDLSEFRKFRKPIRSDGKTTYYSFVFDISKYKCITEDKKSINIKRVTTILNLNKISALQYFREEVKYK